MKKEDLGKEGMSRRDALKIIGIGSLIPMMTAFPEKASASYWGGTDAPGVIFLVGDGMPLGVTRAMHEIRTEHFGAPDSQMYALMRDRHTVVSYMGTQSLSSLVTDSAPASAAWSTGSHTANGMLAALPDGTPLKTIMEILDERGLSTGLVTTTRITHATPAAWVSHNTNRDAEDAIAVDYLNFKPNVLLGGGSRHFDPARRTDHRDLFDEFGTAGYDVLKTRASLESYASALPNDRKLLGLFNASHMSYYLDRLNDPALGAAEPTLGEMTAVALKKLSRNRKGFILQVEAGRIDHAAHANDAWGSIMDCVEMDLALEVILNYMKWHPDTLLIITSDHGNSGWGINGTGPSYNDATIALKKYTPITATLETIAPKLRGKNLADIKSIVKLYTTFDIAEFEAQMIYDSLQPGFKHYPGDFSYLAETVLGKILAHSNYSATPSPIRRGNVGFTSNNHTAEDQLVVIYGREARAMGVPGYIENTDLFKVMCKFFHVRFTNPTMTSSAAKPYIRTASREEWERHLRLHVS
jgi:alkaline phosphatase